MAKKKHTKARVIKAEINNVLPPVPSVSVHNVIMKLCRLCESKDGPFINIFGTDVDLARKIEDLLPVAIDENDELPHKICFRCSARVTDLHEFAVKCMQTQENLYKNINKTAPSASTSKMLVARKAWEEKLNKTKMSNDDYCNALIKKAMAGIVDMSDKNAISELFKPKFSTISLKPNAPSKNFLKENFYTKKTDTENVPKEVHVNLQQLKNTTDISCDDNIMQSSSTSDIDKEKLINLRPVKIVVDRYTEKTKEIEEKPQLRTRKSGLHEPLIETVKNSTKTEVGLNITAKGKQKKKPDPSNKKSYPEAIVPEQQENKHSIEKSKSIVDIEKAKDASPSDVWKNVTSIKVAGVGYIYTCELCSRNFLKKEKVAGHKCLLTSSPLKKDSTSEVPTQPVKKPEVNKASENNYNNPEVLKTNSINLRVTRTLKTVSSNCQNITNSTNKAEKRKSVPESDDDDVQCLDDIPDRKRPGPASRTALKGPRFKKLETPSLATGSLGSKPSIVLPESLQNKNSNTCYKLVPGPNNTFTLESVAPNNQPPELTVKEVQPEPIPKVTISTTKNPRIKHTELVTSRTEVPNFKMDIPTMRKRKLPTEGPLYTPQVQDSANKIHVAMNYGMHNYGSGDEESILGVASSFPQAAAQIALNTSYASQPPYPVGLVSRVGEKSNFGPNITPIITAAMKKQTYTVVQTENPSKLLISAVQKAADKNAQEIDGPFPTKAKRGKKQKHSTQINEEVCTYPAPLNTNSENPHFTTYVPPIKPSSLYPRGNTIQESQISTSTTIKSDNGDVYPCQLCSSVFTREKKLLAHIKVHYETNVEDDELSDIPKKGKRKGTKKW